MTTTFASAVKSQTTVTENGMKALTGTGDACVNLFYAVGGSRGKDIIPLFRAAFEEDAELALRIALHLRDIREGSGERQLFKDILLWLERNAPREVVFAVLDKIPELGRMDDGLVLCTKEAKGYYFTKLGNYIRTAQVAKQQLKMIDALSEQDCKNLLGA